MFAWLKRLFRIGSAEAHAALDKLEDPVKMTEQGIKDLKEDLQKSMTALAEVKAAAIRSKKELEQAKLNANEYENKAIALLQKAQTGQIAPEEADRLASKALEKKQQLLERVGVSEKNATMLDQEVAKMEQNVGRLRTQIGTWENELKTLKARSKVSEATQRLNRQLANVDSDGTINMLEKMKEKVMQQEALAQSYADIADANVSEDDEIDRALGGGYQSAGAIGASQSQALLDLKARLSASNPTNTSSSSGTADSAASTPPPAGNSDLDKLKDQLKNGGGDA